MTKNKDTSTKINWIRVIANGLVAFCTATLPALALGSTEAIGIGIASAIITGLLAAGMEMQKESSIPGTSTLLVF